MTPTTFNDDVRLGRSMLAAFARSLGLDDLQPGVLARVAGPRARAGDPYLWLGLCVRETPAVPWIV